MSRILAALAAIIACAALAVSLTNRPSAGVTSCARIAHDYVVSVAKQNGLRIDYYKLLACRKTDPDHAVARVQVTVDQSGLTQSVTLVYHLTRSEWQADVSAAA